MGEGRRGAGHRSLAGRLGTALVGLLTRARTPAAPRTPGRTGPPGTRADPPDVAYAPRTDGRPDPGEIVWAWVPYAEGDGRGKDRPVLVIGRRGVGMLGLLLSS